MKGIVGLFVGIFVFSLAQAQTKKISDIKKELEASVNPPLYVKSVLKKRFVLDTVPIIRIGHFNGLPDSLAYHGQIRKVYGPYDNGKILVQVLAKLPNQFTRISQIFLDTTVLSYASVDSIGKLLFTELKAGKITFEEAATKWSMGGENATKGDLGWVAQGALIPKIEQAIKGRRVGDVVALWTKAGFHIIKITGAPKQDHGYALLMRIFLK
ncbi:MAG: peptidyl-prolyl cis-trans isomerase [Chitinophagaceae bacterium]|uniref:peptidylprolyl isomerase n=1 Tax=unclassified Paraflavitalea TaxID=2798305 RepID=UPI003D32EEFE|nr:peptidyl-prolyl cis-trans isomerase [Chitinophagaceae bacterium]